MHNITPVDQFDASVPVLDDGDPVAASQTLPTIQALTNRTLYTNNRYSSTVALSNITTSGGTTTLNASSPERIRFTGSANQNCVLPDETTIPVGKLFQIFNGSTGTITVKDSAGTVLYTLFPRFISNRQEFSIVCSTANGAAAGNWKWFYDAPGSHTAIQDNSSAIAGCIGEVVRMTGSGTFATSNVYQRVDGGAAPLTAGNWQVSAFMDFTVDVQAAVGFAVSLSIGSTGGFAGSAIPSNSSGHALLSKSFGESSGTAYITTWENQIVFPPFTLNLSSPTSFALWGLATFSNTLVGPSYNAFYEARRMC